MPVVETVAPEAGETPSRRPPGEVLGLYTPYGAASPRGATYYARILRCAREHALANVAKLRPQVLDEGLSTGFLWHAALEAYYRHLQKVQAERGIAWARTHKRGADAITLSDAERAAFAVVDKLRQEPGYEEAFATLSRMLRAYFELVTDHWYVLAVEEQLVLYHPIVYSARLDLVVIDMGESPEGDVVRIIEHKSARAITSDLLAGYQLNLQVLGQAYLYLRCVDTTRYPRLGSIVISITSKTKVPNVVRVQVVPTARGLEAFERAVQSYGKLAELQEAQGYPPNLTVCSGALRGFRSCPYYALCFAEPDLDVARLATEDPPPGFVRDGEIDSDYEE